MTRGIRVQDQAVFHIDQSTLESEGPVIGLWAYSIPYRLQMEEQVIRAESHLLGRVIYIRVPQFICK